MQLISKTDKRPYINVIFGNFYSPAYDNEEFVDETMELIRSLGFNSVMFDTKAWEDFKERFETGALSPCVPLMITFYITRKSLLKKYYEHKLSEIGRAHV